MRFVVRFADDQLELDRDDDRVVSVWTGPPDLPRDAALAALRLALTQPIEYPAMHLAMVPGDHVVIAAPEDLPLRADVLQALEDEAIAAGVERRDVKVVGTSRTNADVREDHAYLAATKEGHRVYLAREVVDADVVVPVGLLGYDEFMGHVGPWSVLFPGMGDTATRTDFLSRGGPPGAALAESAEVSWLLGAAFQVGLLPGAGGGLAGVLAGESEAVRKASITAVDQHWTMKAEQRADLVLAGLGGPGPSATLHDLARGLRTATALVRRGGRVVVLSNVKGPLGPAFETLSQTDDPAAHGLQALKAVRGAPDFTDAVALAKALAWADLYLLSGLPDAVVEDLGIFALGRPEEARRLTGLADTVTALARAEWTKALVKE